MMSNTTNSVNVKFGRNVIMAATISTAIICPTGIIEEYDLINHDAIESIEGIHYDKGTTSSLVFQQGLSPLKAIENLASNLVQNSIDLEDDILEIIEEEFWNMI